MSHFLILLKINTKLLLRNKGFLFFLVIIPIVSAFILGIKIETSAIYKEEDLKTNIQELESDSHKAIYTGNSMASAFIVKVYDASRTEMSEFILKEMLSSGMFCICRRDAREMTEKEVFKKIEEDAFNDRAGAVLYLKKDFAKEVYKGDFKKALTVYKVSGDERLSIFKDTLSASLGQVYNLLKTGMSEEEALKILKTAQKELPSKEIKILNTTGKNILSGEQNVAREKIGYSFAIITLGFLFCGVCIAYTVIEEQKNKVYTRIMLSGIGKFDYLFVKFIMAVVISAMQTGVLGICLFLMGNSNFGIDIFSFLLIIFLLGLVFGVISLCTGILAGDIMGANYAVFAIWSISALLAGLYFPLENTSDILKAISFFMPQKWFMQAAEILITGGKGAYSMVLCVTAAYLIVIISLGAAGLKIRYQED